MVVAHFFWGSSSLSACAPFAYGGLSDCFFGEVEFVNVYICADGSRVWVPARVVIVVKDGAGFFA